MKTNFHQRNNFGHPFLRKFILVLIIFVIGVGVLSLTKLSPLPLLAPLWKGENSISQYFDNFLALLRFKRSLQEENIALREKIASLEIEQASFAKREAREVELLTLAGRHTETGQIPATVLVHPPRSFYDILVLDAGESNGVMVGSTVRMVEGPVLGTIIEAYGDISKLKLFSTSGEITSGVLERGNASIELTGAGGGMFKLTLPREMEIEVGDRIFSANIDSALLATVEDISMRPTDSFKEVSAKSPANIFDIKLVMIAP